MKTDENSINRILGGAGTRSVRNENGHSAAGVTAVLMKEKRRYRTALNGGRYDGTFTYLSFETTRRGQ